MGFYFHYFVPPEAAVSVLCMVTESSCFASSFGQPLFERGWVEPLSFHQFTLQPRLYVDISEQYNTRGLFKNIVVLSIVHFLNFFIEYNYIVTFRMFTWKGGGFNGLCGIHYTKNKRRLFINLFNSKPFIWSVLFDYSWI